MTNFQINVDIQSKHKLNYETEGACAFDFKASKDYIIQPGQTIMVETDTAIKVPEGYMLMLAPRSSTYNKLGLILVNSVGIVDQDYCGPYDTIKFCYMNMSPHVVSIKDGDRIGQGVFVRIDRALFSYVDFEGDSRGGFGTTGLFSN